MLNLREMLFLIFLVLGFCIPPIGIILLIVVVFFNLRGDIE